MKIKTIVFSFFFIFNFFHIHSQKGFKNLQSNKETEAFSKKHNLPENTKYYAIDFETFVNQLTTIPKRGETSSISKVKLVLPNSNGELHSYDVIEAPSMTKDMQTLYPEIRSFAGNRTNNYSEYLRFSVSPHRGIDATVFNADKGTEIIMAISKNVIAVYNRSDRKSKSNFQCNTSETIEDIGHITTQEDNPTNRDANDSVLRTFETAISTTGEYTQYHGGTVNGALSAINASLTRVNGVYESDFNVTMELVMNTNIIYTNPVSDPYDDNPSYNSELSGVLDGQYPSGNGYDVGHLFVQGGNNGNAGCIGCVCRINNSVHKGSAFTSLNAPEGDRFDIDYVAHEYGHQFGANHTWTHAGNEGTNVQMEPGSGTTIMGYAGITGATDVEQVSHDNFHSASIEQVINYITTQSCYDATNTGNTTPTVNAGQDLTLPIGTPFRLSGTASDPDGDTLTYTWEQFDENNSADQYPNENDTDNNHPIFRCYPVENTPTRVFPAMDRLLNTDVNGYLWEKVPLVARNADFRFTVRDNKAGGGNNDHDDMRVTWLANRGPFDVTSQSASGIIWNNGSTETITWDVNNTNLMTGAANVDIMLSTDSGITYTTLLANIPNDGSQDIIVPNTPAPYCRIMVRPTDQVNAPFFSINKTFFAIDFLVETDCRTYTTGPISTSIPDGSNNVFIPINVTENTTVEDLRIYTNVTHSWTGDLVIQVQEPNTVSSNIFSNIWERNCNTSRFEDINVTFKDNESTINCATPTIGTYSPASNPLSNFNGINPQGEWNIVFIDNADDDIGTVNEVTIVLCSETATALSDDNFEFNEFALFPNPNKGDFSLQFNSNSGKEINVYIYDISGKLVFNSNYDATSRFDKQIALSNVSAGIYIMKVNDGNKTITRKLVIE